MILSSPSNLPRYFPRLSLLSRPDPSSYQRSSLLKVELPALRNSTRRIGYFVIVLPRVLLPLIASSEKSYSNTLLRAVLDRDSFTVPDSASPLGLPDT